MSGALVVANCFEGGTNGTAITALHGGNSGKDSGNPFDIVAQTAGSGTTNFSNAHPAHGTLGFESILAGGATERRVGWNNTGFNTTATMYGRFYVYLNALSPIATLSMFEAYQASIGKWRVSIDTTNRVLNRNLQGTATNVTTSTTTLAVNTLYRIEFKVLASTTVQVSTIRIYDAAGTLLEENISAPYAGVSNFDQWRFGLASTSAPTITGWFDEVALSDSDWLGPAIPKTVVSRIVGAVTPTSAVVASRTLGAASVRVKVSTTADLATSPIFSSAQTPDAQGASKHSVTGLLPNTTYYYYGVESDGAIDAAKNGTFKTHPAGAASYSFAFGACTNSGANPDAMDTMRGRNPLFFHHLGDLHYGDIATNDPTAYRSSFEKVMSMSRQAAAFANIGNAYNWSDHDSGNNDHDGSQAGLPAAALVYRQYYPHYAFGSGDGQGIYHSYTVGRVRFIVTDLRSYKSANAATDDASKTMFGATQKLWFKQQLLAPEPVKIWCNEVPWTGATTAGSDKWDGYNTERQEIASFVTANDVNVLIISGDMHGLAADNGANSAGGITVCQGAPFSNTTSLKGAPYSQGYYPDPVGASGSQFGWMDVTDTGGPTVQLDFTGYDSSNTARITVSKTFNVRSRSRIGVPA